MVQNCETCLKFSANNCKPKPEKHSWAWSASNPLDKTCHGYIHIWKWELPTGCGLYLQVSNNPQVAIHDSQSSDRDNEIHNLWGRSSSYHCQWQWSMLCLRILQTGNAEVWHSAHNNFTSLPPEQWVCWSLCQNLQGNSPKSRRCWGRSTPSDDGLL